MSDTGNYEGARNAGCTVIAEPRGCKRRKYVFIHLQRLFLPLLAAGKKGEKWK